MKKIVAVTTTRTPFVRVVTNLDRYQVTDVVTKYTKSVFVAS